ncbi:hypothetical protein V5799_006046 [Amblyomma americanum]|uniref:Transposable element P transposase-like GTP-binding insertion domain-containing protein n=1 Tax=Amblyomma americanum TaxID=6943 RepID=A0AAQ4DXI0_AMBAM
MKPTSSLRKLHGINGNIGKLQTCFQHPCDPGKTIHTLLDPPHIFKCIRKNLQKVGKFLVPKGEKVCHYHYSALLHYEEEQAGLRAVPKLTRAHISPNAFEKMSVKLTVELFSESTAAAMEFYSKKEKCKQLHESAATSNFARRMNKLFDCLNSRRPENVRYDEADHIATLKENIAYVDDWNICIQTLPVPRQVSFLTKPTCAALRITLHSPVALTESLLKSGFCYVLSGKFGQDPLEIDTLTVLLDDIHMEPDDCAKHYPALDDRLFTKDCILDYLAGYVVKKFSSMSC